MKMRNKWIEEMTEGVLIKVRKRDRMDTEKNKKQQKTKNGIHAISSAKTGEEVHAKVRDRGRDRNRLFKGRMVL